MLGQENKRPECNGRAREGLRLLARMIAREYLAELRSAGAPTDMEKAPHGGEAGLPVPGSKKHQSGG
ncbi:MAG: hypothetical protein Q7R39_00930 [Dehalococcoidia bacterium]|nr:hypothetical protein [Dehalococcoidia bacterium]